MVIFLSILALLIISLIVGRMYLFFTFSREVKELFSQSAKLPGKAFHLSQLSGLPDPVQRYFRHILKEGQRYVNYVRMTHDGQFKTGLEKAWIPIKGEQYATTQTPGFIWKGVTSMFTARDMYIGDIGRLVVSIFSLVNIVNVRGEQYNQGELLRWLGESVLYPTNLLPGERLQWLAIDADSAKLVFSYNGLSLFFIVTFNDAGEIIQMETERYMDSKNLETWVIKIDGYKKINDILVPTIFEVLWRLKKGDFSYAKFHMKKIQYDKPELF
ncbi:MAG: DUF6544 family protein [Bacteroidota bacterium]